MLLVVIWLLVKDYERQWVESFSYQTRLSGVLPTELHKIYLRLLLVKEMNFEKVCVKLDCVKALSLVEHGCSINHPCVQFVMLIIKLLTMKWEVKFHHIYHEHNRVVDFLVYATLKQHLNVTRIMKSLHKCFNWLLMDADCIDLCLYFSFSLAFCPIIF